MNQDPFSSADALRESFEAGLEHMLLEEDGLGPFTLVLANAVFDPSVYQRLRAGLERRFEELGENCRRSLLDGRQPPGPEDDVNVFLRLMAIGFDQVEQGRMRVLGPWEIHFNQIRAFRPGRAASQPSTGIRAPFDANRFQFNKPFLRNETFWSGSLTGVAVDLLFNKFPFVDLHSLLVPERRSNSPQYLTRGSHLWAWQLAERLARVIPGVGFGYNALGAFASVNHLHFQVFVRERPFSVEHERWIQNGGQESYPACCERYRDPEEAWERITGLHEHGTAYNLLYLPGRLYCLPRRLQGTYDLPAWCGGQAWYEMAGGVVAFNGGDYWSLREDDICSALAASACGVCV